MKNKQITLNVSIFKGSLDFCNLLCYCSKKKVKKLLITNPAVFLYAYYADLYVSMVIDLKQQHCFLCICQARHCVFSSLCIECFCAMWDSFLLIFLRGPGFWADLDLKQIHEPHHFKKKCKKKVTSAHHQQAGVNVIHKLMPKSPQLLQFKVKHTLKNEHKKRQVK